MSTKILLVVAFIFSVLHTGHMSEKLGEKIHRLDLSTLKEGDEVHITTGEGEEAFKYTFTVHKPGKWPVGRMQETAPGGDITGDGLFMLQGSGVWTNRAQTQCKLKNELLHHIFVT